jgi:zinc D-Ala-D-Ala carboxypeptidase
MKTCQFLPDSLKTGFYSTALITTLFRFSVNQFFTMFLLLIFFPAFLIFSESPDLYSPISAEKYLTGQFQPQSHPGMISLDKTTIPVNRKGHFLRKEAADAFLLLYAAFKKEHPGIEISIISSVRNFDHQKGIWEKKWTANASGSKESSARARHILKYSSMPGTSRHHWGTDFDINSLQNTYFESGDGKIIFTWLETNAAKYGFCRPYTAGRSKGYLEEKWHWSYKPLSKKFTDDWLRLFKNPAMLKKAGLRFSGSDVSLNFSAEYVSSIGEDCLN